MKVLITGAGGFLGQRLGKALTAEKSVTEVVLTDLAAPLVPQSVGSASVSSVACDLAKEPEKLVNKAAKYDIIYLLHGIMSGGSEQNFELGMTVNFDATRRVLDLIRTELPGTIVVFTSSGAVYGGELPEVVSEATAPVPQSSYGAEKVMCELLVNDYSRRNWIDGRVIRYPTVVIRPGAPSSATSSFCSGIVREPLAGLRAELPVGKNVELWLASVRTVVRNTVLASQIPAAKFGKSRIVNLPGMTVTVEEILEGLAAAAGKDKLDYIVPVKQPMIEQIVTSWPARFDTKRAFALGFEPDTNIKEAIDDFMQEMGYKN